MGQCSSEKLLNPSSSSPKGLENYVLNNLIDFIDSDVEKLSTGEEAACNTMVTLNQVVAKRWQNHKIWYVNDGVMLRCKSMQLKRLWDIKDSTQGVNDDIVITISSVENVAKKKKE